MFHVTDCEEEWDDVLENEVRPKHFAQLLRPAWHPAASKVDVEAYLKRFFGSAHRGLAVRA